MVDCTQTQNFFNSSNQGTLLKNQISYCSDSSDVHFQKQLFLIDYFQLEMKFNWTYRAKSFKKLDTKPNLT